MLSLIELRRAVGILDRTLPGARLDRICQTDEYTLVLEFRSGRRTEAGPENVAVLLCCRPDFARVSLIEEPGHALPTPPRFTQFLRAHLANASFGGSFLLGDDRQAVIRLGGRDGFWQLLLSILGPRSNLYLLDAESVLVSSLRPLDTTRSDLAQGRTWISPESTLGSDGTDRWGDLADEGYFAAMERFYLEKAERNQARDLARRISSALGREERSLMRKADNLREDLEQARQASSHRHHGELLKGALHSLRKGDASVVVRDYESGDLVEIPLDPRLSPSENLGRFFAAYQKRVRGIPIIEAQLDAVRRDREVIRRLRLELETLQGREETEREALFSLAAGPRVRRLLARHRKSGKPAQTATRSARKPKIPSKLLPRRYTSTDGLEIWVGRSDEGNDYLTTRLAHGHDLFFHLEDSPGSHVVLRTRGKEAPPPDSVIDACELAVHFSKLKNTSRADVHVASIKNVRKPPRSKPGLVHVLRGKTVHLRRDPARLERILAARLDE